MGEDLGAQWSWSVTHFPLGPSQGQKLLGSTRKNAPSTLRSLWAQAAKRNRFELTIRLRLVCVWGVRGVRGVEVIGLENKPTLLLVNNSIQSYRCKFVFSSKIQGSIWVQFDWKLKLKRFRRRWITITIGYEHGIAAPQQTANYNTIPNAICDKNTDTHHRV